MSKSIKSLTILLHAIVLTAVLANLSLAEKNSTFKLQRDSSRSQYHAELIRITEL